MLLYCGTAGVGTICITPPLLSSPSEEHSILMDCGEGTHGQLVRLLGSRRAADTLRRLSAIYISHLHADHHIGTEPRDAAAALGGGGASVARGYGECVNQIGLSV